MNDPVGPHGLGRLPSPPDERDWKLAAFLGTDADLRDQAVTLLKKTTVGYQNTHWTTPPAGSYWAQGLAVLAKIGATPPPPPPPPAGKVTWLEGIRAGHGAQRSETDRALGRKVLQDTHFWGAIEGANEGSNAAIVAPSRRGTGAQGRAVQSDPAGPLWDSDTGRGKIRCEQPHSFSEVPSGARMCATVAGCSVAEEADQRAPLPIGETAERL